MKKNDRGELSWKPGQIDLHSVKTGDMPGDKIEINGSHFSRINKIFPYILEELRSINGSTYVVSVYGGSGVGKSEIGSLLGHYCTLEGFNSYVLSGDNYVRRIPEENDRERLRIFETLGNKALETYLGSENEIDFTLINNIIKSFKKGSEVIELKRMGRNSAEIYSESVNFKNIQVLIIEWTHGNNPLLSSIDYPIFLYSTPKQTMAHRISRGRDKGVDSPFVQTVLEIEQEKLTRQAENAKLIVTQNSKIISYKEFLDIRGK